MKKLLPWVVALPLLCISYTAYAGNTETSFHTTMNAKKHLAKNRKHFKKRPTRKQVTASSEGIDLVHIIDTISSDGTTLSTSDGTMWQIVPICAEIALRWTPHSTIVISPSSWYSKYEYYLTNASTDEKICARIAQRSFSQTAKYIEGINLEKNTVTLSSGIILKVFGKRTLASWRPLQPVLFGVNTKLFGGDYILINTQENNYVTVNKMP